MASTPVDILGSGQDYEEIMVRLADEEGWVFRDGPDEVVPAGVFDGGTYLPALLKLADQEIEARGLDIDLGISFEERTDAQLGVGLVYPSKSSVQQMIWRICMTAYIVDHLPKAGHAIDLAMLRDVFRPGDAPRVA